MNEKINYLQKIKLKKIAIPVAMFFMLLSSLWGEKATAAEATMPPDVHKSLIGIQQRVITGLVTDSLGTALAGVSVTVKDKASIGTTTDLNGRYSLEVPNNAVISFSLIGYEPQEISLSQSNEINVKLVESVNTLDDFVVVGFGKQKRTDMIGSVVSVKPSELKIPSSNLTTALAGRVAGMIAYQRSGEPGMDNADFFIRGVTTFGYKVDPLILIDNVEVTTTDLARLQVDDIESFSIMKDATATAIYGARGANGVILVTTKQGKEGPAKLNLRLENSISSPTRNVELADPITYMKLHNEAVLTRNPLGATPYSFEKIDNTVIGSGDMRYPTTDWQAEMLKDITMNQRANLSVTGGGKVSQYFVSGAFSRDNGVLKVNGKSNFNNNVDLKTYTLRANVNINLTNSTQLWVRLNGSFDDYVGPINGGQQVYRDIMRTNPVMFAPYYPNGDRYPYINHILFGNSEDRGSQLYLNPYADMVKGYKEYSRSMMLAQLELRQDLSKITEGLSFRAMANTTRNSYFDVSRQYSPFFYSYQGLGVNGPNDYIYNLINEDSGTEYLNYVEGPKTVSSLFYMESALNYNRTFNSKHNLSGLMVFIVRNKLQGNAGNLLLSLPFRNVGLSGRTTYSYDSRYFAEFNFGYNGSERFHKSHRFGFFPSVGLAWSVSNEKFWEPIKGTVSNLRLRGTYGLVGNDAIGGDAERFFYLSNVNMNAADRGAAFGTDRNYNLNGIVLTRYANPDISWETSKKYNLAIELGLFNKTNIQVDIFKERRTNILMPRTSIPSSMGLAAGISANIGEASGQGLDASLDHTQSFTNGSWLQARVNFTYATSKYEVYEEPQYKEPWLYRAGYPLSINRGFIAERLFLDDEDVQNSPVQNFGEVRGGDIKYVDVNNDGQITNLDRVPLGYPTIPEVIYGFGFSYGIKSFDASIFFQGSARSSFWIDPSATAPFVSYSYYSGENSGRLMQNQLLQAYADSHWSESNQDIYALWPRLSDNYVNNNLQSSTWFMREGTFLRLKQAEIGYSLPKKIIERVKLGKVRFYASGTNLLSWSKFKLWDIEMAGNGLGYPVQRVFNFGVQLAY